MKTLMHTRRRFLLQGLSLLGAPLLAAPGAVMANPAATAAPAAAAAPAAGAWQVQHVATDHLEIEYASAGPESGRPVVLVHAPGGSIGDYAALAALLAAAGVRVLVPSLRGHGATRLREGEAAVPVDAAVLGQDLLDLIDATHVPEAVFVATGRGAEAVFGFAAIRARRCKGLVLLGASAPAGEAALDKVPVVALDGAAARAPAAVLDAVVAMVRVAAWRT